MNRKPQLHRLLVEGKDDLYVVTNIRDKFELPDNFDIINCEGVVDVVPTLNSLLKNKSPIRIIGVVIDADADTADPDNALQARWDSLRSVLTVEGYTVPKHPDLNGTIIQRTERLHKIGIWLMPDNSQRPGMLEHFVVTLIPPDDVLKPIAESVLAEIETLREGGNQFKCFKPVQRPKALIHTWLAWQDEPGRPMGVAIKANMLDHNTELCQRFAMWLKELFG